MPRDDGPGASAEEITSATEVVCSVDADDALTMGRRLRQIRQVRRKSLRVVAGLAGISAGHLSRIEAGERALDRRSLIVALADALQISPSCWPGMLRDTAVSAGLVAAASARVGLAAGAFDLANAALDAVTVPTNTPETMQLSGFLALRRSVVAAADGQPNDLNGSVEYATELAGRTGEGNAYGLGFGPIKVGLYRMAGLLEVGDNERAAAVAESLTPEAHINRSGQAAYWADYGRALAPSFPILEGSFLG